MNWKLPSIPFRLQLPAWLKTTMAVLFLLTLISFVEKRQADKRVKKVLIEIDHEGDNYFVEEEDVMDLMTGDGSALVVDKKYSHLDLKQMEKKIKSFKFVSDAQVSKDHKGNLKVFVKQRRPIARLISSNGAHVYVGSDGTTLSTSEKFTSRVVIVDGGLCSRLASETYLASEEGKPYLDFFRYLDHHKFWKVQIAQISTNSKGELTLYPQLGKQYIQFGKPELLEDKFARLAVFYKKIIPAKGWNTYQRVDLRFKDQIICE
ncbi:MAG: cell division protein FtsQ [Cytophagaceae bacterium]|jgi:cell division protein FtsQ|nr:cell division protein FtsQ [Cytophagaceae bacterium]